MGKYYPRQSIESHYLGPTDTLGSRIVARASSNQWETSRQLRKVVPYDYALNATDNHVAAMKALAIQLGWLDKTGMGIVGSTRKGYCMVFFDTAALVDSPMAEWMLTPIKKSKPAHTGTITRKQR